MTETRSKIHHFGEFVYRNIEKTINLYIHEDIDRYTHSNIDTIIYWNIEITSVTILKKISIQISIIIWIIIHSFIKDTVEGYTDKDINEYIVSICR